ncbi:MAG: heme exporter protein CcmB [Rickettsiales bacterium]
MMALLRYELMYYFKNKKELTVISILFLSFFILLPFSLKYQLKSLSVLSDSVLWLAMLTSHSLAGATLYERDRLSGRLDYYPLLPQSLESVVLIKWLASYLAITMPMVLMTPLVLLLSGRNFFVEIQMLSAILVGSAAISAITNLNAALLAGIGQGAGAILGLLVLPLAVPVIIFGSAFSHAGDLSYLLVVLGFTGFLLPLLALGGASCLRHAP